MSINKDDSDTWTNGNIPNSLSSGDMKKKGQYIELSNNEIELLNRRGFYSKKLVNSTSILLGALWLIITAILIIGIILLFFISIIVAWKKDGHLVLLIIATLGIPFIGSIELLFSDIKKQYEKLQNSLNIGVLLFTQNGVVVFQDKYIKNDGGRYSGIYGKVDNIYEVNDFKKIALVIGGYFLALLWISAIAESYDIRLGLYYLVGLTFPIIIYLIVVSILGIFHFHYPLYAFGNLGEKIQSLTPHISEQSKQIELEFRGDMDFRVLSKSFDSLASTFSDIISLVIKLEQVEQKANKGNLFDSDKYINSLREDIRTPLLSLKTFLETKKVELQSSQQELMRVRVSVGGEGENRELQSVRSQELLKELDENIGKLDVMIGKL